MARSATSYKLTIGSRTFTQPESDGMEQLVLEDHVDMVSYLSVRLGGAEGQPNWGIKIGDAVECRLGAGNVLLFKGEVTAMEPSWAVDGLATLTVRCMDHTHRLARGRKTRFFENQKDSDVVQTVGGECGLSVDAEATQETHAYILQRNESNLAFLKRLAARNNYILTVDEGKLTFKKAAFSGQATTISMGTDLRSVRMHFNTHEQVSKVEVRGWDIKNKRAIVGTAESVTPIGGGQTGISHASKFGDTTAYITDVPVSSEAQAKVVAQAELDRLARQFAQGSCTVDGNDALRAGSMVEFNGLAQGHNGKFFILASRHIVSAQQGYLTEITFCSNTNGS
jgi:phage protein D